MALVSSLKDMPIGDDSIAFGEIGLAGEIRSVSHAQERVNEAARLGFSRIVLPFHNLSRVSSPEGVELIGVINVREAFEALV